MRYASQSAFLSIIYKACMVWYGQQLHLSRNNGQTLRNCVLEKCWHCLIGNFSTADRNTKCNAVSWPVLWAIVWLRAFSFALLYFTLLCSVLIWSDLQSSLWCCIRIRICWALKDKHFSNLLYSLAYLIAKADPGRQTWQTDRADKLCQCGQDANALGLNNWTSIVSGLLGRK